jgi:hypothetical protein
MEQSIINPEIPVNPEIRKDYSTRFKPGQSGNPAGRPPTKNRGRITALIEERLAKEEEAKKFMERLFELYYSAENKQALSAGIQILERTEGKIKDVIEVDHITNYIPDQAEAYELDNMFKIKKDEKTVQ